MPLMDREFQLAPTGSRRSGGFSVLAHGEGRQYLQSGRPIGGMASACVTAMGLRPEVQGANLADRARHFARLCRADDKGSVAARHQN
jgi:hypothetical protein